MDNNDSIKSLPVLIPRLYRKLTYKPLSKRSLLILPDHYANRAKRPKQLDQTSEREIARRLKLSLQTFKNRPPEMFETDDNTEAFCYKYGNYPDLLESYTSPASSESDKEGES